MYQTDSPSSPLELPERLGPYRLLQLLGEGAMGIVYEAEELGPVRRVVALKVVRADTRSRDVMARFDAERQALAVMNHPAIASVYNAGATEDGRPYFSMELVPGLPLTTYCDQHRLSTRERLALFIEVCRGVQHAHQKAVIHRDLKPSNILVTEQEGRPQPKIIDFGIAKALGQQLTNSTLFTQQGQALGTAAYMSPEQAESSGIDIDTRSDIFSLGVILYELLVGRLPIDPEVVGMHAFMALLASGAASPPQPSDRLRALKHDRTLVAYQRASDPQQLQRELRGDLDCIVMKAMEPNRARRYDTANLLAMDIERYLANEPIVARAPGAAYRFRKFVRRNRIRVTAAAVAGVALLLGAASATVGMVRATRAERVAAQEAAAAREVTAFLVDLFRVSDPGEARGNEIRAREVLDRGEARVRSELADQPLLQGRLMHTMGRVYSALGLYDPARRLLEDALRRREQQLGLTHPELMETLDALGTIAREEGDYELASSYHRRALSIGALLRDHDPAATARSLGGLAAVRLRQGQLAEAESLYVRAVALHEEVPQLDHRERASHLNGLAIVYWSQRRYAEADPLFRRLLATQEEALGEDHLDVAVTLNNLGGNAVSMHRYADALPLYERSLEIFERRLGTSHPDYLASLNNLGETYWKLNRHAEAEPILRSALAKKEEVRGPNHPSVALTLNTLAGLLRDQGRYAEAEPLYRRALRIRERVLGRDHPDVAETRRDLATLLRATGRGREADELEAGTPATR